ncbi:MAG: DNA repair protein RecO [Ignavibacteria bacterium]
MTKILKDKGFVLKKRKYRETSKLITIFSKKAGKLNLIAKGVRTPKSKISAVLDPINLIEFVYYDKPTRDLQYISSADFIENYSNIKSDFEKIKVAYFIIELIDIFSTEGQSNEELFNLVLNELKKLDEGSESNYLVLNEFLISLCEISGYPIYTGFCPLCNKEIEIEALKFVFTRNYGLVCFECGNSQNSQINLDVETKKVMMLFLQKRIQQLKLMNEESFKHLFLPVLEYLKFHVEEIKKIKSLELF